MVDLSADAVTVGVLENQDAVAFFALRRVLIAKAAVVDDFADPDAAEMVDVDVGRAVHHGFGGEERCLQVLMHIELGDCVDGIVAGGDVGTAGGDAGQKCAAGALCEDVELHCRSAALIGPAVVDSTAGLEIA